MTNSNSIQDVLFFPQMKPEKKVELASNTENIEAGVREELIPILQKAGVLTMAQLKQASANKLFNDVCGLRKKMKLDVKNPTKEEVENWIAG
jgi:lysyl-tRNA synthetase class 2